MSLQTTFLYSTDNWKLGITLQSRNTLLNTQTRETLRTLICLITYLQEMKVKPLPVLLSKGFR